jgi:hypothetical protein
MLSTGEQALPTSGNFAPNRAIGISVTCEVRCLRYAPSRDETRPSGCAQFDSNGAAIQSADDDPANSRQRRLNGLCNLKVVLLEVARRRYGLRESSRGAQERKKRQSASQGARPRRSTANRPAPSKRISMHRVLARKLSQKARPTMPRLR